jgi:hypothetical protein
MVTVEQIRAAFGEVPTEPTVTITIDQAKACKRAVEMWLSEFPKSRTKTRAKARRLFVELNKLIAEAEANAPPFA